MFPITSEKEVFAKKNKINFDKSEENIYITSEKVQRRTEKKVKRHWRCTLCPLGINLGGRREKKLEEDRVSLNQFTAQD